VGLENGLFNARTMACGWRFCWPVLRAQPNQRVVHRSRRSFIRRTRRQGSCPRGCSNWKGPASRDTCPLHQESALRI